MELQIQIIGYLLIILALVHLIFPTYFKWKTDLANLQLINRQLMYVHTFFIALMVFLMGLLCVVSSNDLIHTKLGKQIAVGFAFFWGVRCFFQFFVYSSKLWKGKVFETIIHVLFTFLWIYLTFIFYQIATMPLN
jgi:hypothetical protein